MCECQHARITIERRRDTARYSVLQACCSLLQACCSVLQRVTGVLQRVAACYRHVIARYSVIQACCGLLQAKNVRHFVGHFSEVVHIHVWCTTGGTKPKHSTFCHFCLALFIFCSCLLILCSFVVVWALVARSMGKVTKNSASLPGTTHEHDDQWSFMAE